MYNPLQLSMAANAEINGVKFTIGGVGVVRVPGVYEATLNFSDLPSNVPPGLLATFLTSACCNSGASERMGSLNLGNTGVTAYSAERTIDIGTAGRIVMSANATLIGDKVSIQANLKGDYIGGCNRSGHAIYYITAEPLENGRKIRGVGEGSLFDCDGRETRVTLNQIFSLMQPQPIPNPLTKKEFRILTEDGVLSGLSYRQRIHSICEPSDIFSKLQAI